jgi:hypothetical protein
MPKAKRKILKAFTGGFVKFKIGYIPRDESFIVFTGNQIIEKDLSEDAATRLAQFLNCQEYLNTDQKARAVRAQPLPDFDFDRIYELYPRRIGKKTGIERLKKTITTIEKYELLESAVRHYASEMQNTEEKFIKHFSSWVSCWHDWIPEGVTTSSKESQLSLDDITNMMNQ